MEQSIKLKIAGKEFSLKAKSPEQESLMRRAAERINASLAKYDEKFPQLERVDKLIFVALNESVSALSLREQSEQSTAGLEALAASLDAYLNDIKTDR
ncbi:MAG: cell division protein ZapA [Bacteroidales bacterium]|nr:cell division protein ZapA [Bacteroidales bacterium]